MHSRRGWDRRADILQEDKYIRTLATGLALLLVSLPTVAQSNAGRIPGTVTDQTGAALPGATVTSSDLERGTSRVLTTDDAGT